MSDLTRTPDVNTPCGEYVELETKREKCRDLLEGAECLKSQKKAQTYLPRNPSEQCVSVPGAGIVDPWQNRVERSRLNNMFRDAVGETVGRIFAKEIEVKEETPEPIKSFLDDVDGSGSDLDTFMLGVATQAVAVGSDFVLVDYPQAPEGIQLATEEAAANLAPYWTRYPAESVIDWRFEKFGKETRLSRVRLREEFYEPDGDWGMKEGHQVRVIYAGDPRVSDTSPESARWARYVIWREVKTGANKSEWAPYAAGILRPQVDIPLVEFPTDMAEAFESCPPFLDLAHLTIAHFRKQSDLDNAQHAVGYPVFHWAGGELNADGSPVGMGPNRFLVSRDPSAHAEFVEPEGTSWASLRSELDAMERQGKALAVEPMEANAGALTATGEAIRAARSHSKLAGWVLSWENAIDSLFYFTGIYLGIVKYDDDSGWGGVKLNKRFAPKGRDVEGARLMHERNVAGKASDETTFEVLQLAEIVPDTVTYDEERERLSQDGPSGPSAADRAAEDLTQDPAPNDPQNPPMDKAAA